MPRSPMLPNAPSRSSRRRVPVAQVGLLGLLVFAAGSVTANGQDPPSPLDDEGRVVRFERDIAPILRERCLECHGPDDAKNDFRVDDSYSMLAYIEPGELEFSMLYTDYLTTEDVDLMMPPASHGGPLSAAELALIRTWIDEGADWPDDFEFPPMHDEVEEIPEPAEPAMAPQSLAERIYAFQGFLHPATIHFPIALLTVGALFVVLGVKWPTVGMQIPLACLLLGAVSAITATVMGWSFASMQGYGGWTKVDFDSEIFWHRWGGVVVTVVSTLLAIVALVAVRRGSPGLHRFWKVGLLVVAVMVGLVGHQGGELTYGQDFYPKAFRILFGEPDPSANQAEAEGDGESQDAEEPQDDESSGDDADTPDNDTPDNDTPDTDTPTEAPETED